MLGLTFSCKLDWGSYISSTAKAASNKIIALIHSMKFLSSEVALYFYKSTIWQCMKHYCHAWADAPICYLEMLDKLQKCRCRTLVLHLLPLVSPWLIIKMQPAYVYFGRHASELAQLVSLPYSRGRSICYSDTVHDHQFQMLQGCICQQFLSLYSQTLELFAYKMLSFDL